MGFCCCSSSFHPSSVTINGHAFKQLRLIGEGGRGYIYVASLPNSTANALKMGGSKASPTHRESGADGDDQRQALLSSSSVQVGDEDEAIGTRGSSSSVRSSLASRVSDVFGGTSLTQVALKRVMILSPEVQQFVLDEAEIQRSLSQVGDYHNRVAGDDAMVSRTVSSMSHHFGRCHPNICGYLDSEIITKTTSGCSELWIAMELCEDSVSLQDVVNNRVRLGTYLTAKEVLSIALQCCSALGHLHTQTPPITHWDFKLCNLLVTEGLDALPGQTVPLAEGSTSVRGSRVGSTRNAIYDICQSEEFPIKLCDFGSAGRTFYNPVTSVQIAQAEIEIERRTTLEYRSPESLDMWHKVPVGTPCDMWAFGVLLYTLLFQEMPFEPNAQEILSGFPRRTHPMPMWQVDAERTGVNIKGELLRIVTTRLLVRDPAQRATVFEIAAELATLADRAKYPNPWLAVSKLRTPHAHQLPRFDH